MYPQDTNIQQDSGSSSFDAQVQGVAQPDTAALDRLEKGIVRLTEKLAELQQQCRRLQDEKEEAELAGLILKDEMAENEQRYSQTINELNEALKVQVSQLRGDMQKRLDDLAAENARYRRALENGADGIERLLADWDGA
ncbi:hypothetical protein V6667_07350 [Neisseria leonii]|uniref:Uncharacterized protein n=1 Tax=Neisseria leonii TaxID=2995413 RepID=A0A9X4IDV6_9NEIS|nr:hypothetical protein [Neisseria sp. 51.81]MDD9327523.1 hypothetical protein [Neisseria sp. 51.81]